MHCAHMCIVYDMSLVCCCQRADAAEYYVTNYTNVLVLLLVVFGVAVSLALTAVLLRRNRDLVSELYQALINKTQFAIFMVNLGGNVRPFPCTGGGYSRNGQHPVQIRG